MLTPLIIAGSGTTPFANAKALIEDYMAGLAATNGDIEPVIYWALDESSNDTHVELFDWMHDPDDEDAFDLAIAVRKENLEGKVADLVGSFAEEDLAVVQRPGLKAVQMALEHIAEEDGHPQQATLLVLWNDAEEDSPVTPAIDAMEEATRAGIEIRDLCAGLQTIEVDLELDAAGGDHPTLEELEAMDLDELKERAAEAGLEIPKRSRSTTYASQLNEHYRVLEAQAGTEDVAEGESTEVEAVERARAQGAPGADALTRDEIRAEIKAVLDGLVTHITDSVLVALKPSFEDVLSAQDSALKAVDSVHAQVADLIDLQSKGLAKVVSYVEDTNARVKKNGAPAETATKAPAKAKDAEETPAPKTATRATGRRLRR